ncbi:hypothetical protein B0T18DRAFT_81567 [Schizothecium vesticola]|uniref:Uncharacterized protein n=1 Tax=Schizothecium vesticola TaxID=314040 RepID=A0AA40F6C2_9PEZI|nr:hypothetical protein B0T18DRAFT_81567 [Schizothecium vesticola]
MLTSMLFTPDAGSKGSSCKSSFLLDLEFRLRRGDAGGTPDLEWLGLGRRELTDVDGRARGSAPGVWKRCSFGWVRPAIGWMVVFPRGTSCGVGEGWQTWSDQIAFGASDDGRGGQGTDFSWDWEGAAGVRQCPCQPRVGTLRRPSRNPLGSAPVGTLWAAVMWQKKEGWRPGDARWVQASEMHGDGGSGSDERRRRPCVLGVVRARVERHGHGTSREDAPGPGVRVSGDGRSGRVGRKSPGCGVAMRVGGGDGRRRHAMALPSVDGEVGGGRGGCCGRVRGRDHGRGRGVAPALCLCLCLCLALAPAPAHAR